MLFTEQLEVSITKEPPTFPPVFYKKLIFPLKNFFILSGFFPVSFRFLSGFHGKKSPMQSSMEPWKTSNHRYHRFAVAKKNPAGKPGGKVRLTSNIIQAGDFHIAVFRHIPAEHADRFDHLF